MRSGGRPARGRRWDPRTAILSAPLDREPWVRLANGRELEGWSRRDELAYNQAHRQAEKHAFYVQAFDFLTENGVEGDYHEYGCHRARTFRMALTEARRHNLGQMKFFAFDSFEGLPRVDSTPAVIRWTKGALRTSEKEFLRLIRGHGIYVDRCQTVKGFYQETLTPEVCLGFQQHQRKIALVCVDCDLYESAVPVLEFIEPLLQEGSVVYVDDMFSGYRGSPLAGVARAFREFEARSRFGFVPHLQVGWWGRSFIAYGDPARARSSADAGPTDPSPPTR